MANARFKTSLVIVVERKWQMLVVEGFFALSTPKVHQIRVLIVYLMDLQLCSIELVQQLSPVLVNGQDRKSQLHIEEAKGGSFVSSLTHVAIYQEYQHYTICKCLYIILITHYYYHTSFHVPSVHITLFQALQMSLEPIFPMHISLFANCMTNEKVFIIV